MAWIRRVRTASGATAVQIAESVQGRRRIIAHVGSAHTDAELGLLMQRARELLDEPGQGQFDLGVEPMAVKASLIGPPANAVLFGEETLPARERQVIAAPRVVATASRVLYDVLAGVFTSLGFDALGDEVFRDLVIARLVEPTSILDTGRVLTDLGRKPASEKTMRRTLTRAHQGTYRDTLAELCFAHATNSGDVSLVLYDVTTLYFEAEKEDELRRVGYSKERRVDPQIVVGLLVDRGGFPLEIGCFEGNKAETATIVPIVKQFADRHDLADMVIVADAGMLSGSNLRELDEANLRFIVGSRMTKAPIDLASHFHWHGDAFDDGQVIDTITPRAGRRSENDQALRVEPVWGSKQYPRSWRAVWAYSAKRAARDNRTLTAQENRARAVIDGEKTARTPRFIKTTINGHSLDQAALDRARQLVGLKGYVTNIPVSLMAPGEVISSYHDLWRIEQSFRMSKTDLAARPMFVRTRDAIEAHLTIVFTALAVARTVQDRTGLAVRNLIRQLCPLRSATIAVNGTTATLPPQVDPDRQVIIDALAGSESRH